MNTVFQKVQKAVDVSDFRAAMASHLAGAKKKPLVVSARRGGDSFVVLSIDAYNKLVADARKVITRVLGGALALDPFSRALNTKKLEQPLSGYRLRIGDYRVLYTVDTKRKQI